LGYHSDWQVINSCEHGVPQLRPRFILVAIQKKYSEEFHWPEPVGTPPTVGKTLLPLMKSRGWQGAEAWAVKANGIGPTLVGGSRKHGGPDLGPTRARAGWLALGVDGKGLANEIPDETYPVDYVPRLTVKMAALVQGFPTEWEFSGRKTAAYRQVGNAFPPPVAKAIGKSIRRAIGAGALPQADAPVERRLKAV
jgi:DNA (cytosine-5)-methyltransferase 1